MTVKTSSWLKSISGLILLLFLFAAAIFYVPSKTSELNCAAEVRINVYAGEQESEINGVVHMIFHLPRNGRSYISEYGVVSVGEKRYKVDRNVRLVFSDKKSDSYSEVLREGIDKNMSDTLPDDIAEKMTSSQRVFFFKVDKLREDVWRISDLRRTIFICKKIS